MNYQGHGCCLWTQWDFQMTTYAFPFFTVFLCLYLCCPHAHLELRLETCEGSQKLSGSHGSKCFPSHQYRYKEADVSTSAPHKRYSRLLFLILPLAVNQTAILLFKKTWNLCWHTVNTSRLLVAICLGTRLKKEAVKHQNLMSITHY